MNIVQHCFGLAFCTALAQSAYCQPMEMFQRGVFMIKTQVPAMEDVGTDHLEVWHRVAPNVYAQKFQSVSTGTAFFVQHNHASYIVTAKHVVGDANNVCVAILMDTNWNHVEIPLADMRAHLPPGARWFFHPRADVALHPYVFPLTIPVGQADCADWNLRTNHLELLSPVCAVGFPLSLGVTDKISPIAAECKLASWLTPIPGQDGSLRFLLLDRALAQGYSGCPIYTLLNPLKAITGTLGTNDSNAGEVLGVLSSQMTDIGGGKVTCVVPSLYIWELFQQPDFIEYEKARNLTK